MRVNLYTDDRVLAQINNDIAFVIYQLPDKLCTRVRANVYLHHTPTVLYEYKVKGMPYWFTWEWFPDKGVLKFYYNSKKGYKLIATHEPLEIPQVINDIKYYIEKDGL